MSTPHPMPRSRQVVRDDRLDLVFHALADRTRRAMIARLARGGASISELASPFEMSLPGASKHVRVLEQAGLVQRSVDGRVHRCELQPGALELADAWIEQQCGFWTETLDALARYADEGPRR
jgi:DNA-binding transcriptional ArsR family regulator